MALRVLVCRISDVAPGQMRAFQVTGVTWPVIVTVVDGAIVACPGVCPHEDVALWEGSIEDAQITCPGHGWMFDLRTGRCRHNPSLYLRRYPVTVVGEDVYVDLL